MQISSMMAGLTEQRQEPLNGHSWSGTRSSAISNRLDGRRYLVVEDEYLIAGELFMALEDAGAEVFGPLPDLDGVMEVLDEGGLVFDAAILDINLHGILVYPAAKLLAARGTPFVFVTGYEHTSIPKEFANAPCLTKPVRLGKLIAILANLPQACPT